ncbi:MAG: ZIP family metal transporter [Nocardioidaceae bacterium]
MVIAIAFGTLVSTTLGGLAGIRLRDRLHLVLGLAAGVMLGLVAFDLLPEVFALSHQQIGGIPVVMVAFTAGFLALHVVERTAAPHQAHESEYGAHEHPSHSHEAQAPTHLHGHEHVGIVSGLALAGHSFMDGVGIGLAFQVNDALGVAVAIAVVAHDFADGLNTVTVMVRHGNSDRRALAMLAVDAIAPVLGAISTLLFSVSDQVLSLYLGFFAGFLLYLATADILPEAHARHPTRLTMLFTFAGVALMWLVVSAS